MIIKDLVAPNGAAVRFHVLRKLELIYPADGLTLTVQSFADEASFLAGANPLWNTIHVAPLVGLAMPLYESAESWLIEAQQSELTGGAVVADLSRSLQTAKDRRIAVLKDACRAQIAAGFQSDALGVAHLYPAKDLDQTNLVGSVVASLIAGADTAWVTPFWCADAAGVWAFEMHTAGQIQQVGIDSKASILAALSKNEALASTVASATSISDVEAVKWNA
jgi:hypothetical protein